MNILIAEDEFATADAIQRLVDHMGHTTRWACSGPEALISLEKTPCELMILSAQLRDADITFLLPSLRRHHPDLPVVALTSRNSLSLEQRVRKWGVIYYLVKPLNIEELGSIVSRVSIESLTA
jgi:DNA-binding response OmpR family regulator